MALRSPYTEALAGPEIVERLSSIDSHLERVENKLNLQLDLLTKVDDKLGVAVDYLQVIAQNSIK